MDEKLKIAVVLSGAGMRDGSEIHESVLALLAIVNNNAEYVCFAPDIELLEVNHMTNQLTGQKRGVLFEAARIARGNVKNLKDYNPQDFAILVFSGGAGVIKNLCNFAEFEEKCDVNPYVRTAIAETHRLGKPIVALCIAPVLIAKVLGDVTVTVGNDKAMAQKIYEMGGKTEAAEAWEVVLDAKNKIVTTPCYMLASNIGEVAKGVDKAIKTAIDLVKNG